MPTWLFRIWSPCPEKCCNSKEQLLFLACLTLKTKTLRSFEMLRTTHPATQRHNPADWNIFYTRILPAEKIKIPCLGCDRVQFDRRGCLRGWDHLHQHGQSQLHTITPQHTIPNTTSTAQCLLYCNYGTFMSACSVITLLHGFTCFCTQCWRDTFIIITCSCIFSSPL